MDINIRLLEKYCQSNGYPVIFSIPLDPPDAILICVAGENREGSLRQLLEFADIDRILHTNSIIGDNSLVAEELRLSREEEHDRFKRPVTLRNLFMIPLPGM